MADVTASYNDPIALFSSKNEMKRASEYFPSHFGDTSYNIAVYIGYV